MQYSFSRFHHCGDYGLAWPCQPRLAFIYPAACVLLCLLLFAYFLLFSTICSLLCLNYLLTFISSAVYLLLCLNYLLTFISSTVYLLLYLSYLLTFISSTIGYLCMNLCHANQIVQMFNCRCVTFSSREKLESLRALQKMRSRQHGVSAASLALGKKISKTEEVSDVSKAQKFEYKKLKCKEFKCKY